MSDRDQQSALKGARSSEPSTVAGPELGQAFQEQIGQALQPAMAEIQERIAASVRRELEQKLHREGSIREPDPERPREHGTERRDQASQRSKTRPEEYEDDDEGSDVEDEDARPRARSTGRGSEAAPRESSAFDSSDRGSSTELTGRGTMPGLELGQVLQEQIGQALQPAMAEFREQMAATVRRELDETLHQDQLRPRDEQQRSTTRRREEEQPAADGDEGESADGGQSKASESTRQRGSQTLLPLLGKPLLEALPQILEQQGEHWLRSRLDLGIDVVFSGWVRAAAQQDVERMLQVVPRVAIELVPDRATREDLRAESKQMVETLVENAFDRLFSDEVRDDLKARGHQAIKDLVHPNLKSVVHQIQELLLSLLEGLLAVLRECWEQILQFLLKVVIALVQSRLASGLKDVFSSLAVAPDRSTEKRGAEPNTALEDDESEMRETEAESADDVADSGSRRPDRRADPLLSGHRQLDRRPGGTSPIGQRRADPQGQRHDESGTGGMPSRHDSSHRDARRLRDVCP